MTDITPQHVHPASPFDVIRLARLDGTEYWSARSLMLLMGYTAWRNFEVPINRAMKSAEAQGHEVQRHFAASRKISDTKPAADFELTRFAAYLVAMNGDPNKPEVAAAQAYFAIKTREAEVAQPLALPQDYEEALIALVDQVRETKRETKARVAMESYARELEPKADSYDRFLSGDGTYSVGSVAKMLGRSQNKLFADLRNSGVLIAKGAMANTPYQKYMHHFAVKAYDYTRSDATVATSYTTRVQPSGVDFIARKLGCAIQEVAHA